MMKSVYSAVLFVIGFSAFSSYSAPKSVNHSAPSREPARHCKKKLDFDAKSLAAAVKAAEGQQFTLPVGQTLYGRIPSDREPGYQTGSIGYLSAGDVVLVKSATEYGAQVEIVTSEENRRFGDFSYYFGLCPKEG